VPVTVTARVRFWRDEEGWGVVEAPETPGGCWTHFSAIASDGYPTLTGVEAVELEFEQVRQDGFDYRAVRVVPPGATSSHPPSSHPPSSGPPPDAAGAYSSVLTLEFDDGRTVVLPGDGPSPAQ
jgi:cold shock protein